MLAVWGAAGYLVHCAEAFGSHVSLILRIPGGLFELTFGIWLLAKGIRSPRPSRSRDHGM